MRFFGVESRERSVVLNADVPLEFDGDVNEVIDDACSVVALFEDELDPASEVAVRFTVLEGPLQLLPAESSETVIQTDQRGRASVDARFTDQGFAVVGVELVDDRRESVSFRGHSDGVTHRLFIYADPYVSAEAGEVEARIVALDRHDRPVSGASIHFEGTLGTDEVAEGTVTEVGDGEYEGRFETTIAGPWTLMAQDLDDHVLTYSQVQVLPGAPHDIRLVGETDPRASQPYRELLMRARLEDRYGNALDPHRIQGAREGQVLEQQAIVGDERRFSVEFAGYGSVEVELSDTESQVATQVSVEFAAAWFEDPGTVQPGSTFTTRIYALPPPDRPAQEATIEIGFDPEMASFDAVSEPSPDSPVTSIGTTVEDDVLSIAVEGEAPIEAEQYPDGVYICDVTWNCLAEGEACFNLVGRMSPSTPGWEKCVSQKKEDKKCLCVNVIYKPGDANGKTKGEQAAKQVESVISSRSNVQECCPIIEVDVKSHEMTPAEWNTVNAAIGGDQQVSGIPDWRALNRSAVGKESDCINMYMLPFNAGGTLKGLTGVGPPGTSALDPSVVGSRRNVGAHEVGHALGMNSSHASAGGDPDNLMVNPNPPVHGDELTDGQCKTIWQNIDSYAC